MNREDNKYMSDFSVTFKQFRMVESITTTKSRAGRADDMFSDAVEKGSVVGVKVVEVTAVEDSWAISG